MRARRIYTYTHTHTHPGRSSQRGRGILCRIRRTGRKFYKQLREFYHINYPCQKGVKTLKVHIYRRKVHIYRRKVHIYRRKQILRSPIYAAYRAAACPKILKVSKSNGLPPIKVGAAQI